MNSNDVKMMEYFNSLSQIVHNFYASCIQLTSQWPDLDLNKTCYSITNTAELLSKTSEDVVDLLTVQLRSLQHLESIQTKTASIESIVDAVRRQERLEVLR